MDYCSSCSRTLNGALVCPGCGEYAPDIAPPARGRHAAAAAAPAAWDAWNPAGFAAPGHDADAGAHHAHAAPTADGASGVELPDGAEAGAFGGSDAAASTGQGRAARRRQLARWKKHRRRAAAATAVALVGGGLTVSLLQNKPSAGHTQAATTPDPERGSVPGTTTLASAPGADPNSRAAQHRDTRPSATAGRDQSTAATPPSATTFRHPDSVATAHPAAAPRTVSHAAPAPAERPHVDHAAAAAPAPAATAPAGTGSTTPARPAPAASTPPTAQPTSPTNVCLLGLVCVGS
ncbi:SCO2400 family protein [Streptomyces sp. YGL11-2]|uniref:SCO2400 family protein n=1 Tax=Streptomyces sp. YGL11-2 TaxID=3414028 RepID=UPI003CEC52C4